MPETVNGVEPWVFAYYFRHLVSWKKGGFYRGGGPGNYPPWYADYLFYMDGLWAKVEAWQIRKNHSGGN